MRRRGWLIPGVLKPETLVCNGRSFPFTGGTSLGFWTQLGIANHAVTLGSSATFDTPSPAGSASTTITVTQPKPI